jgi:hypothetical protein
MKKMMIKGVIALQGAKNKVKYLLNDQCGEGYLDVLVKILITVILGAALLGLLRVAIPDLFDDIMDKIRSVFTI